MEKNKKSNPYLGKLFVCIYYFFEKNRRSICGKNNNIQIDIQDSLLILKNVDLRITGDENTVIIKIGAYISDMKIEIRGNYNVLIIKEKYYFKGGCLFLEDYECKLIFGKRTSCEKELMVYVTEPRSAITIGEDCMFAYGIVIRSGDSHSIVDLDSKKRLNYAQDIQIDNHVWIGTRAQILKGVHIGNNSVIAACSVITKDVPKNSIAAGVPAQIKRN